MDHDLFQMRNIYETNKIISTADRFGYTQQKKTNKP